MRIRRIKVRNFAGIEDAELSFPDTGITIIEGVNEVGKTSMIKAVDMLIKYLDSSGAKPIKDAKTAGTDLGPEAEVDITAGEYEFTYRKRWLRDKETVLEVSAPSHEQLSGREAHERVDEILEEAVDLDLWKALRLDQGTGLSQATFDVSALGRALDTAAGGDVAGDREDALFDRIETDYLKLWTAGGKPRGELSSLRKEMEEAQEQVDTATAHLQELDDYADEIQRLDTAAGAVREAHVEATEVVEELSEQVEEVAKIERTAERLAGELERAQAVSQNAQSDRERRDELVLAVETATTDLKEAQGEMKESAPARQLLQNKKEAFEEALSAARNAHERKREFYESARDDSEYCRQLIEIEQLTERRDRVVGAQKRLSVAENSLESAKMDAKLLGEIEEAHLGVAAAKVAAERSQPTVDVKTLVPTEITVDGTKVAMVENDHKTFSVLRETHIVIPEVAEFVVSAGEDDADVVGQAAQAQEQYDELCRRGGVADFTEAREQENTRAQAERDQASARMITEQDLRDLTFDELTRKLGRVTDHTFAYAESRKSEPTIPDGLDKAQEIEAAAKKSVTKAESKLSKADALAQGANADLNKFDVVDASLKARVEIAESTLASALTTVEHARNEKSDKKLRKAEAAAEASVKAAHEEAVEAKKQLEDSDADSLHARLSNAKAVMERCSGDLRENEDRRRELRFTLSVETERGPAQFADEASSHLVETQQRHDRLASKAAAIRLLHDVFKEHRDAARQRYNQPFSDQIKRLGRIVYGSTFEVTLDDDLSIEYRTLHGTTLGFDQLSTGAQEQLGLIARLACATLVADEGGVPVIFDDALGWTDPGRLERMGAAISTAADECQIIILTCVPDRYSAVGKASTVTLT